MESVILNQLDTLEVLPSLRHMLAHMASHDVQGLADSHHWDAVIPVLASLLHVGPGASELFGTAWRLTYAAICRLDHLQDGDLIGDSQFATLPANIQYQLVFSYYLFATSFLDTLDPAVISAQRLCQLRQLWTSALFRVAGGQQSDLAVGAALQPPPGLESYQAIIHNKAGALFALAFAGTALLSTVTDETIQVLYTVGDLYGTLVQYVDDLTDAADQPNQTATLATALVLDRPDLEPFGERAPRAFFEVLYCSYYAQTIELLSPLPVTFRDGILGLFHESFGRPTHYAG
jgi:Polyprenyl synthetase